ncbi:MAG: SidA/IucD/PvdA family monooxygenase, partial [Bacteriovoracaceae bacterium]
MKTYNLIGLGIGPFHLSLAALMKKTKDCSSLFLERKNSFTWHPELMFDDAQMQTTCFKDLVTAADPTSPFSFMNYLVQNGLYYSFMNTGRLVITRREFELYCSWVARSLEENLLFEQDIKSVDFTGKYFTITTSKDTFQAQNISVATGHTPRYPQFVSKNDLSNNYLHAKSEALKNLDLTDKNVIIIGGGQTGLEVFSHALKGKWKSPRSVRLISKRGNLSPLDESSFTNEYFTPNYVDTFYQIDDVKKAEIVKSQKLASDGNT